ncbi:Beta-barrel assembly machine subunit BamB [Thiogranum longum]|uniref:Outer membrane protein assembly factor BamB n=1 Tax=Thiogranum longum TaxID=1537524 RepID=A0A4R1HJS9_9GAMM|nr:outer membrane protein assembly factor BamB [Thiogranum longum]TCK17482.1 Beta-barrel assembly machine subunit BamB [Thiogranum longum]
MMRNAVFAIFALMLLGGCSWFGDKDNSEPPAKLQKFDEQLTLRSLWSRDTGVGTDGQRVKLVPAIFGERVYTADRRGRVSAYLLEDGEPVWRKKINVPVSAGPGVDEGLVLVGTSDARVLALDTETGEQLWTAPVSSEVLSVPRVYEGVVVVQTVDGNLTGVDAESGKRIWIHDRTVPVLSLRGTSTPLVEGGLLMAGFANGKLVALDVRTGRQLWEAAVAVPSGRSELQRMVDVDADPVVRDGVLYVASFQGQLAAVSLQNGRLLWSREMSAYAGIAVDYQQVYVTDELSNVWALDRRTGASLWKNSDLQRRFLTGPVVVGGYIAVGDFEGYIHLLSRIDGALAGRERVERAGILVPAVALGDRLLVLGAGGKLVMYRLKPVE